MGPHTRSLMIRAPRIHTSYAPAHTHTTFPRLAMGVTSAVSDSTPPALAKRFELTLNTILKRLATDKIVVLLKSVRPTKFEKIRARTRFLAKWRGIIGWELLQQFPDIVRFDRRSGKILPQNPYLGCLGDKVDLRIREALYSGWP